MWNSLETIWYEMSLLMEIDFSMTTIIIFDRFVNFLFLMAFHTKDTLRLFKFHATCLACQGMLLNATPTWQASYTKLMLLFISEGNILEAFIPLSPYGWSVIKFLINIRNVYFFFSASCSSSNSQKWNSNWTVSFVICCSLTERGNFLVYTRWKVSKIQTNTFSISQSISWKKITGGFERNVQSQQASLNCKS